MAFCLELMMDRIDGTSVLGCVLSIAATSAGTGSVVAGVVCLGADAGGVAVLLFLLLLLFCSLDLLLCSLMTRLTAGVS